MVSQARMVTIMFCVDVFFFQIGLRLTISKGMTTAWSISSALLGWQILGEVKGDVLSCDLASHMAIGPHGPKVCGKSIKIGIKIFPHSS